MPPLSRGYPAAGSAPTRNHIHAHSLRKCRGGTRSGVTPGAVGEFDDEAVENACHLCRIQATLSASASLRTPAMHVRHRRLDCRLTSVPPVRVASSHCRLMEHYSQASMAS